LAAVAVGVAAAVVVVVVIERLRIIVHRAVAV